MNKKLILILLATVLIVSSALFLVSCGEESNIDHIEIYSMPKTEYVLGESFDLKDARILIKYHGNRETVKDITPDMISSFDPYLLGEQYIKVYFANHSTAIKVTVSRPDDANHELITLDAKYDYVEGQLLDTTNIYMLVNFVDGSTHRIDVTPQMCSGFNPNKTGSQTITVKCVLDGKTYQSTFSVGVRERELIGIEVTSFPTKDIYYVGDRSLDLRGGVLFLKYDSTYSQKIDMADVDGVAIEGLTCTWDYEHVNDRTPVTVSYKGHTAQFPIQVKIRDVVSYDVITPVQKQMQNLDLDLTGAKIRINYNNEESEEVLLPSEKVVFEGFDKTLASLQDVTMVFYYGGVRLTSTYIMQIDVAPREASHLRMVSAPRVYQDTVFNIQDFRACVVYNNGEEGEVFSLNDRMVAWENDVTVNSYETAGTKNWYVNYNNVEMDYSFEVIALRVQNLELYNAVNVYAFYEGEVDTSEVRMTITYNNGLVVENVSLPSSMVSFDNTVIGLHKAVLTYTDKYESGYVTDIYVNVVREIASIVVSGYRTEYVKGETFSALGMEIIVSYVGSGENVTVREEDDDFNALWTFRTDIGEGLVLSETGTHTVYVMNAGLKEDYPLTVQVRNEFKSFGPVYRQVADELEQITSLGDVIQGNSPDLTNLVVLVTREGDVEYVPLTAEMIDYNHKITTVGERRVTVYYPNKNEYQGDVGRTTELTVNVIEKSVQGIRILKSPDRTIYFSNTPNAVVEYDGMEVSLVYDNGTMDKIDVIDTINRGILRIESIEFIENGEREVDVFYTHISANNISTNFSTTFTIQIVDPVPISVEWKDGIDPMIRNTIGSSLDLATVYYWEEVTNRPIPLNEKSIDITFSNSSIKTSTTIGELLDAYADYDGGKEYLKVQGYNANEVGSEAQNVQIFFGDTGLYLPLKVKVSSRTLYTIEVLYFGESLEAGELLTVIQGAAIDLSPLSLKLIFSDDSYSIIPMESEYINLSASNPGGYNVNDPIEGQREVTVSYTYTNELEAKTCKVIFDVKETSLVKIEINDIPKIYFIENEEITNESGVIEEGSIMLYYDNGTTAIEYLSTFSTTNPSSSKFIDISNFNNKEFSGFSKVQRIHVRYNNCTTSYNIYMRDRRNAEIEYQADNVYTFTYGEVQEPVIALNGYYNYSDTEMTVSFVKDVDGNIVDNEFTVRYIPEVEWLNQTMDESIDYSILPTAAGRYVIVVSYLGDDIHNAFESDEKILTINKKTIYVGFKSTSKIYGNSNPEILLTLGATAETVSQDPLSLFAYGDTFTSANFNPTGAVYTTRARLVDALGNTVQEGGVDCIVTAFNIIYRLKGEQIEINNSTGASGRDRQYTIAIANQFVSPNYNIIYKEGTFTINPRKVQVIPESIAYVYGASVVPTIPFTTSYINGDPFNTGIYNNDTLLGNLARNSYTVGATNNTVTNANAVGTYYVNIGNLQTFNPNYEIVGFTKETNGNNFISDNGATVSITPRPIYVKVDNVIRTYGQVIDVAPQIKYFSDAACMLQDNAFARGDDASVLGEPIYVYEGTTDNQAVNQYTSAGEYYVYCTFSGDNVNYKVESVKGIIEVAKRPVLVTALPMSKVYGDEDPVNYLYETNALANIEESGLIKINGVPETLGGTLSRENGTACADYNITIGTLGANSNYDVRFTSALFSILKKEIYVEIQPFALTKVYDGKTPSIVYDSDASESVYKIYESRDENAQEYHKDASVYGLISFEFVGSSKNAGSYKVNVSIDSSNYSIATYDVNGYTYTINKKKVAITKDEFVGLPNNSEYNGEAYVFSAFINKEDLQQVYNIDGTPETDDDNKPKYDDATVLLSMNEATDAKTYTVNVLELVDKNYELDLEKTKPIEFTIVKRIIYVNIKTTDNATHTIEREFNNQNAYIAGNECTLENLINDTDRMQYELAFYDNGVETTPKNVKFNNGEVDGYDIEIKDGTLNKNFIVQLKEDYKFKIIPKTVTLRINASNLKKNYDGNEPSITTAMFQTTESISGFNANTVSFTFVRDNDGRDNASVGSYSISVTCSDGNFNVRTQETYIYQIQAADVTVSIASSALEKAYDGEEFKFTYSNLSFNLTQGTAPIIHNFRYGEYEAFDEKIQDISRLIQQLANKLALVDFNETVSARKTLGGEKGNEGADEESARYAAYQLYNALSDVNRNPMQANNTTDMILALHQTVVSDTNRSLIYNIEKAVTALDNNRKLDAQNAYLVCKSSMQEIKNIFAKEESYCAFIFGDAEDNTAVEVGNHKFDVVFKDYNRNFRLLNSNKVIKIVEHTLLVNVNEVEITYGYDIDSNDSTFTIAFELFDPRTNTVIDISKLTIQGEPKPLPHTADGKVKNVGRYEIDISAIKILEDVGNGLEESPNYVLSKGTVGELVIIKAPLSIKIKDVKDPDVFVYGKSVESSQLNGSYEMFNIGDGGHIDSSATNIYRVEALEWANANGYGDLSEPQIFEKYFGKLYYGENIDDVLKTAGVRYNCYINGISGTEIFDTTSFDAGDYRLSATGFRADNYEIKIIPGVLTVAKRVLTLYTQNSGIFEDETIGYYEKEYGNDAINYIYAGFVNANNDRPENVKVFLDSGNGVPGAQVGFLKDIMWNYSVESYDETNPEDPVPIDPILATTEVYENLLAITPNSSGYVMTNYEINFVTIGIKITKAPLKCTIEPTGDVPMISSIYMDLPDAQAYKFKYTGYKNDDENLGLIPVNPTVSFKDGANYYNKGTHNLGENAIDIGSINEQLRNYELTVVPFSYEVTAREVYVTLEGVNAVMSTRTNSFTLNPYLAEVSGTTSTTGTVSTFVPNKVTIYDGQYGQDNFKFSIYGVNTEIQAAFDKVTKKYFSSTDTGVKFDVASDGKSYKEIYRYNALYKHAIDTQYIKIDYTTGLGTARLKDMQMNTENFKFVYEDFQVQTYNAIYAVEATMTEKFVQSDLSLSQSEQNQKIKFNVYNYALETSPATTTVADMISSGILNVNGAMPSVTNKTVTMTYTLNNPAYNYVLCEDFTSDFYKYYYDAEDVPEGSSNINVTDARMKVYDYSAVATCTLPIRFYAQSTSVVTNPDLVSKTGLFNREETVSYGIENTSEGKSIYTSNEYTYNAMRLEFSLKSNKDDKVTGLQIAFNGTEDNEVIRLIFNMGVTNTVGVTVNGTSSGSYSLPIGNLFGGDMHDLRVYLDKENLTLIIYVDGVSGAVLDLGSLVGKPDNLEELSTLSLTMQGTYLIKSLTLSEQGLYDGVGAHIRLPVSSNNVISVSAITDEFTTSVEGVSKFFGLTRLNDTYSAVYYVDGEMVSGTTIQVSKGMHIVELALYKDNVLVDYDYTYLYVNRKVTATYVNTSSNVSSDAVPGANISLYPIKNGFTAPAGYDANLVASAVTSYQYAITNSMEKTYGSKYTVDYFKFSFSIEPAAIFNNDTLGAEYLQGEYKTTIDLVGNQERSLNSAYLEGDIYYVGTALELTRTQTNTVTFGEDNTAYTYTAKLLTYKDGSLSTINVASGLTENAFEITVYRDRNNYYYGRGGVVLEVKNLLDGNVTRVNNIAQNSISNIFVLVSGSAERLKILDASFDGNENAIRDYNVNGSFKPHGEVVALGANETLTVRDANGNKALVAFNTLTLNYTIPEGYVPTSSDVLTFTIGDEYVNYMDGTSGNTITLKYYLLENKLTFAFNYQELFNSRVQTVQLNNTLEAGTHIITVKLDKTLNTYNTTYFVGGDNSVNLFNGDVKLTETMGNVVHYSEMKVYVDGELATFYMPLYNSVGLWIDSNGVEYGTVNDFSSVEGVPTEYVPTFLCLYQYAEVSTSVNLSVNGFMLTDGECNAYDKAEIIGSPII